MPDYQNPDHRALTEHSLSALRTVEDIVAEGAFYASDQEPTLFVSTLLREATRTRTAILSGNTHFRPYRHLGTTFLGEKILKAYTQWRESYLALHPQKEETK